MTRNGRLVGRLAALVLFAMVWLCPPAWASHSLKELVSTGPNGGNAAVHAFAEGASQDGSIAVFGTTESLVTGDTDTSYDLYKRTFGSTTLLTTGPTGGNGANDAYFDDVSDDGSRVFFETDEKLVSADTDNQFDIYERSGTTTTLLTTGPSGGNGAFDVFFDGISKGGNHLFFNTDEALVAGDTNGTTDLYDRSAGTPALLTGGTGQSIPVFGGSSDDGTRVFFETGNSLAGTDTDGFYDVYERTGGTTTQVSIGTAGGNGAFDATYAGNSQDGSKVFFDTQESLVTGDTDSGCGTAPNLRPCNDVYQRAAGATTQVSTAPAAGNGSFDAIFDGNSGNGAHVFFSTSEPLLGSDTDAKRDVYERFGGATTPVSTGPAGGNGAFDSFFDGNSLDGTRVFFDTQDPLVGGETDNGCGSLHNQPCRDVYQRAGGTTTLISTGANGGNGAGNAVFAGASLDGLRVFFQTPEAVEPTDTDTGDDIYERFPGGTTQISIGPNGGNGAALPAALDFVSADGSRVLFNTRESLISSDTDATRDVYAATVAGFARPKAATPVLVPLVVAYAQCTAANSTHGAPLSFGSCTSPVQTSSQLTVGSPDANGRTAQYIGSVRYDVMNGTPAPADDADVALNVNLVDVRLKASIDTDYTGELSVNPSIRMTDKRNGASQTDPGTGTDITFPATVPCTGTSSTTIGSTCSLSTTLDAITAGAVPEGSRSIWQLGKMDVFDGGPDGLAGTSPNTLFVTEGIFIP